jgi:hypothetical protein
MLLAECKSDEVLPKVNAADCVRLRISSTGEGDRYVNLPLGKTTVGSSPRCNIRIQEPGVQPLDCLIVREAAGLSVRRWAAGTRLNGQPFDESALHAGDRLTVGSVELELDGARREAIAPQVANDVSTDVAVAGGAALPAVAHVVAETFHAPSESAVEHAGWDSKFDKLVEATSHLAGQKAALASDIVAISARLTAAEQTVLLLTQSSNVQKDNSSQWTIARDELKRQQEELDRRFATLEAKVELQEHRLNTVENDFRAFEATQRTISAAGENFVANDNGAAIGADQLERAQSPKETTTLVTGNNHVSGGFIPQQILPYTATALLPPAINGAATETLDDEIAPFAEFSIWKQGAAHEQPPASAASDDPAASPLPLCDVTGEESPAASSPVTPSPASATTSFIERYSHLFAEENAQAEDSLQPPPASPPSELTRKPRNVDIVRGETPAQPTPSDDEESIEHYMAKLLERVRGESSGGVAPQVREPSTSVTVAPSSAMPAPVPSAPSPIPSPVQADAPGHLPLMAGGFPPVANGNAELLTSLGTMRRKSPAMEDTTNMESFRALANETARRAISTHGLQKHRRNAITKVIVSTLAGMTSLWMMLEAPNSRDLQFTTACVSLMIAVYWMGQTICELLEAFRAASYDGPEDQLEGFADAISDRSALNG